jgi:hypothetical protein
VNKEDGDKKAFDKVSIMEQYESKVSNKRKDREMDGEVQEGRKKKFRKKCRKKVLEVGENDIDMGRDVRGGQKWSKRKTKGFNDNGNVKKNKCSEKSSPLRGREKRGEKRKTESVGHRIIMPILTNANTNSCDNPRPPPIRLDAAFLLLFLLFPSSVGRGSELTGSSATSRIGCFPRTPFPSMTILPTDGTPLTTTKISAGPGAMIAGLGGSWETCSVPEPSVLPVKVELSWTWRWPIFLSCKDPCQRMIHI